MPTLRRSARTRFLLLAVLGGAAALVAGCAKTGKVAGKVTLPDGSPLPGGIIMFSPDEAGLNPASATIKEDGTYEVADVPTGLCKVSIDNRMAGVTETPVGAAGGYGDQKIEKGDGGKKGMGGKGGPPGKGGKDKDGLKYNAQGDDFISKARQQAGAPQTGSRVPIPGQKVDINKKYYTPDGSGLTFTVSGGSNTFDVKLSAP